jgi:tRNA(Ile)-lysidine synthase
MIPPGATVAVALSGGPDSMALLAILAALTVPLCFSLSACHFNHRYRPDADDDARFAEACAARFGVPFRVGDNPDPKPATGLMAAARAARYRFFDRLLIDRLADRIATGHTVDDAAETSLMRMLAGAGPTGFAGIPPVRDAYVRPLIDLRKKDLIAWLDEREIPYRIDPTNASPAHTRNRVRAHILPTLEAEEPEAPHRIVRLARQVAAQTEALDRVADRWLDRLTGSAGIDPAALAVEPEALRHALYRRMAVRAGCDAPLATERFEAADELVTGVKRGKRVELGHGYEARLDHAGFVIAPADEAPVDFAFPFALPLAVATPNGRLVVRRGGEGNRINDASLPGDVVFRNRREGDYLIRPAGRRSLKRFFIDAKVPARLRERLPLLASGSEILWIPGLFVAPPLAPAPDGDAVGLHYEAP